LVKIQIIEKLFLHILTYSFLLLPLLVLILKLRTKDAVITGLYGFVMFVTLSGYIYQIIKANYLYITVYTFLEYLFFTSLIWLNIVNNRLKVAIAILSSLFVGLQIISYLITLNSTKTHAILDSVPVGVETILVYIYITFFFYESLKNPTQDHIYTKSCFWLCIGMLIYLGGTFFFNILLNHMDTSQVDRYWFLTYIADTAKNLCFCLSIFLVARHHHRDNSLHRSSVPYLDLDMN
jgi:hypothetical protein